MAHRIAELAALGLALAACGTTTQGAHPVAAEGDHWVRDIALAELRGEVGRPFASQLSFRDNYLREPEIEVSGLPDGLGFDPSRRTIVGTPRKVGFYTINVAIRTRVPADETHRPTADERWWPARFELEIDAPVE